MRKKKKKKKKKKKERKKERREEEKEGGKNGEGILRNPNVTPIFIMSLSREIFSVENGITNW